MAIDELADLRRDLDTRSQIHDLVVRFYREIAMDDLLGPVFGEVAEVDWAVHIPRLIDYWCRVLLGQPGYDGYVLAPHRQVHELEPFRVELFDRWYLLFVATLDDGWDGPIAETARTHAARIARSLARRLLDVDWTPPKPGSKANVQHGDLPTGLVLRRTTDEFSAESVPAGLLRAHRLASGVWGLLRVTGGSLAFVWEDHQGDPVALVEGDAVVIPPEVPHRVEPRAGVRFVVELHR